MTTALNINSKDDKIIRSIFLYYDTNHDEVLTFYEFKKLCNDLGYDLYDVQFKYINKDINDTITYNEFKEWWLQDDKLKILFEENVEKVYYAYNVYKKGIDEYKILDYVNFNKMIDKYYHCSISEEEFNQYNKNGDNVLEFNEFLNWLRWIN